MYHLITDIFAIGPVLLLVLAVRAVLRFVHACRSGRRTAEPRDAARYDVADYLIDTHVSRLPKSYALTRLFLG